MALIPPEYTTAQEMDACIGLEVFRQILFAVMKASLYEAFVTVDGVVLPIEPVDLSICFNILFSLCCDIKKAPIRFRTGVMCQPAVGFEQRDVASNVFGHGL